MTRTRQIRWCIDFFELYFEPLKLLKMIRVRPWEFRNCCFHFFVYYYGGIRFILAEQGRAQSWRGCRIEAPPKFRSQNLKFTFVYERPIYDKRFNYISYFIFSIHCQSELTKTA